MHDDIYSYDDIYFGSDDDETIAFIDYANRIYTACVYIQLFTGTLSVIGSGSILYSIWANRSTKLKDPQHRILGMMSIFDIFYSINAALSFLTFPPWWGVPTFGNHATCSLQGFFIQFGVAAASYNMVLSIYYYLSINRGMKKEEFAKVWEKVLHGIVIICHLSFAITGVSKGLFFEGPGYCYVWDKSYMFAFCLGWILLAIVVIVVTNALICLFVRRQEKEMEKYRTRSVAAEQLSEMEKKTSYARSVFTQSMFYVGVFLLSWLPLTVMFLTILTGVFGMWMGVPVAIFNPLQGFFNAFIYARPRYLRLKKKNKHMGFKQLVKLAFLPRSNDSGLGPSAGRSRKDSNVFRSFLLRSRTTFLSKTSRFSMRSSKASASDPAVSETEEAKNKNMEKEKTSSDSKPMQDADEEKGKAGEGETTSGDVSPAEEEKVEEGGGEFLDRTSAPTFPVSEVTRSQLK